MNLSSFWLIVNVNYFLVQTGLTAQQIGTTARWYSNKTSLYANLLFNQCNKIINAHESGTNLDKVCIR